MNQSWIYIRSIVLSIAIRMTYYDLLQNPLQLLIVEVLPPEQAAAAGLSTGEARVQTILLLETVSQSVTLG
jgi:hypothetical protein